MKSSLRTFATLTIATLCGATASAHVATFRPIGTLDISATNIGSCGGLQFENSTGHLWLSGGATGNDIFELNAQGQILAQFDPNTIPGFDGGADALALDPSNGQLFAFSSAGEDEAGILSQTGALIAAFATAHGAIGADFAPFSIGGALHIVKNATASGSPTIHRLSATTGAIEATTSLLFPGAPSLRVGDCAFDPFTKNLFVLLEDGRLFEIDMETGGTFAFLSLTPFLPAPGVNAGMTFNADGSLLYVSTGGGGEADVIHVFEREFAQSFCVGGVFFANCPCGNNPVGEAGCNNSFLTGGASLRSTGQPSTSADTFQLTAASLPPATSCFFFQGSTWLFPVAFGDGLRCVGGQIVRIGAKSAVNGTASYPEPGDAPISSLAVIPVGSQLQYQVWYRDNATFCSSSQFNLTNGLVVDWL